VRFSVSGVNVDFISHEQTIQKIVLSFERNAPQIHRSDLNVSSFIESITNTNYRNLINCSDIINVDGMGLYWGLRILGYPIKDRIAGIDLMNDIISLCCERGKSIFFLGARDDVLKEMIDKLIVDYPGLKVAGYHNGYFWGREDSIVQIVNSCSPDVLFVGIKSPEKENFIANYRTVLDVKFVMGVGGAFDVMSGRIKRAPVFIQKLGMEWMYRLVQEPRRLWKRYFISNSLFIWFLIKEKFRRSFNGKVR